MVNNESHLLKPFFNIIEESKTDMAREALKIIMKKKELDSDLLDFPKGILPEQTGVVSLSPHDTHFQNCSSHALLIPCITHHLDTTYNTPFQPHSSHTLSTPHEQGNMTTLSKTSFSKKGCGIVWTAPATRPTGVEGHWNVPSSASPPPSHPDT